MKIAALLFASVASLRLVADVDPAHGMAARRVSADDVQQLPPYVQIESVLAVRLPAWTYARCGQCEVLADGNPEAAAAIARDCSLVAAFVRQTHPEAAVPEGVAIRLVLDSGQQPVVPAPATSAYKVHADRIGIFIAGNEYGPRQVRAFRRELVKSGFASQANVMPLWYRLGLKNIIAEADVTDDFLSVGRLPLSPTGTRFMLRQQGFERFDRVFALAETSADYQDADRRFLFERQATAFLHVALFDAQGRYAQSLANFLNDPERETAPSAAFERAFGFNFKALGRLVRNAAQGDYQYCTIKFRRRMPAEVTTRPATREDVFKFRGAFE